MMHVVLCRAWSTPGARSLRFGVLAGSVLLFGCPLLLEDGFEVVGAPPGAGAGGGSAGLGSAGASGNGGAGEGQGGSNAAGAGGSAPGELDAGVTSDTGSASPGSVLREALLHRYQFGGSGTTITDSAGTAHGSAVNASIAAGTGKLTLSGTDQYVDLPNGLVSSLESVTLEAWVNWLADPSSPAAAWQNIFTFGTNDGGEGAQGIGTAYLSLTAQSGDSGDIRAGYTLSGFNNELVADGARALPLSANPALGTQVALVVDGALGSLAIYIDGVLEVATPSGQAIALSAINDVNNWLGRAQFATDPELAGELLEFRIYGSALGAADVALSFELGADADL